MVTGGCLLVLGFALHNNKTTKRPTPLLYAAPFFCLMLACLHENNRFRDVSIRPRGCTGERERKRERERERESERERERERVGGGGWVGVRGVDR